jgi:hypothetical protein
MIWDGLGIGSKKQAAWQYTMLPMLSDEGVPPRPLEYLEMISALGATGWELVAIVHNCFVFKKPC